MLSIGDKVRVLSLEHLNSKYFDKIAEVENICIVNSLHGSYLVCVKFELKEGIIHAAYYENELEVA